MTIKSEEVNEKKLKVAGSSSNFNSNKTLKNGLILLNLIIRIYSSFYMIISDCDETFNYWEPLNLIIRGFGKETWEYSPEYAIRSYSFLIPYYILNYPVLMLLKFIEIPSYYYFYWIRLIGLCGFTSFIEIKLSSTLTRNFNYKVGNWFLLLSSISTGMSHASVALLPSSFAMQTTMLATLYSIDSISNDPDHSGDKLLLTVRTFTWFMIGGIVGWPFTLVLSIPFGIYTLISQYSKLTNLFSIILKSIVNLITILIFVIGIDKFFYKSDEMLLVPLNIVLYNVFGGEGEGPEIFGIEPFHYYILNLLVNFNIIFIIGFVGLILNGIIYEFKYRSKIIISISTPLLIWSIIFGIQPHKEERFLYPIYPLINLSASLLIPKLLHFVNFIIFQKIFKNYSNVSKVFNKLSVLVFSILVSLVSILRIINLVENYSAPLIVSSKFNSDINGEGIQNVCIGREWYHFPTSFFLPDNYRLRFVRSGFDGLLPGDFLEGDGSTLQDVTSSIPPDMNNLNLFSESKLIEFNQCDYYIDNNQRYNIESHEFNMIKYDDDNTGEIDENWEIKSCNKLINPDGVHTGIGKLIYIPNFARKYIPYNVEYMNFCIFKKNNHQSINELV